MEGAFCLFLCSHIFVSIKKEEWNRTGVKRKPDTGSRLPPIAAYYSGLYVIIHMFCMLWCVHRLSWSIIRNQNVTDGKCKALSAAGVPFHHSLGAPSSV